ncbi:type VI secretion protein [Trinickia symbiotica]|uniref:Type VI secretion protein n=1 Tax=Trinickia symbiotica TaxID=863227 RepID=A0A2T3XMU7_9BURK|nr:VirB3 family type IV secretion system protein [Trinickia symbiotica]PTB17787.1 type VI secretion protein [Trinickia symbiotica]
MTNVSEANADNTSPTDPLVVKVNKTTLEQFRLLGVDRPWTVIEFAIVALIAFGLKNWYVLAAPLVTHPLLWLAARKDPDLIQCYLKYRKQGDHYEPRQHLYQRINCRPIGFGRGALL